MADDRSLELAAPFEHRQGFGWTAPIPPQHQENIAAAPLNWTLREGERALGPGNAMDGDICTAGGGRYAIWPELLCFSTSDNSDPNANGRAYRLTAPPPPEPLDLIMTPEPARPTSSTPLVCAIVGLGARGTGLARRLATAGAEVRWLADISPERLVAARAFLPNENIRLTEDAQTVLADPEIEAVFITAPDPLHAVLAKAAFAAGKHVFLEKPVATTLTGAWAVADAWMASGRILQLGYVLRDALFYQAARAVVASGRLGLIHALRLTDDLSVAHGASYMRRWHRRSRDSGGLMVHKGCHDLDLACWLLNSWPVRAASFGGNYSFTRPAPAKFCSQCPERSACPYEDTGAYEDRTPAQRADPTAFGLDRCVFSDDKDIVDTQTVAFELANGARGTYGLAMHNPLGDRRTLSILGQGGRLDGDFERGTFTVHTNDGAVSHWPAAGDGAKAESGHGGGDSRALERFLGACQGHAPPELQTPADALRGLVLAFAAERARMTGAVVRVREDLRGFE